jgi:hypothetical protein
LRQPFLDLEAGGASTALLGHQGAKWTFVAPAMMRQLPGFDGPEGDGQAGSIGESTLVLLKDPGICEGLDQPPITVPCPV